MKEYKVGERFKHEDVWLWVVERYEESCKGCFFAGGECCPAQCCASYRVDNKNIHYIKTNRNNFALDHLMKPVVAKKPKECRTNVYTPYVAPPYTIHTSEVI
ncbi:hypothetical protein OAF54_03555 [bacterium]|nr:hypothetical protein [bacterium]